MEWEEQHGRDGEVIGEVGLVGEPKTRPRGRRRVDFGRVFSTLKLTEIFLVSTAYTQSETLYPCLFS